ncbi:MAG TPA: NADH-quinone oxidoreductase subunit NuoK, partial [Bryobacteraceae bacterium]|nr:NADH-quinone oxidoreductase subunit NuoK [Bryobacteraceae bacterium]
VRDRVGSVAGGSARLRGDGEKEDLTMQPITTVHYLALSAALLLIGTVGVLTRRNTVIILMSIELILNAVNINLIAFSHALHNVNGQIFAIFVITDAVAEAAVGLGILIALFRNKETVLADEIDLLKW